MGFRNPYVWMILILLIVLLFGASRLPDITRNIGKSLKIFKEEVRDLKDDSTTVPPANPAPSPQTPSDRDPLRPDPGPGDAEPEDPPHAPKPPTDPR